MINDSLNPREAKILLKAAASNGFEEILQDYR